MPDFKEEIRFYVNFIFVQNELFIEDFSKWEAVLKSSDTNLKMQR